MRRTGQLLARTASSAWKNAPSARSIASAKPPAPASFRDAFKTALPALSAPRTFQASGVTQHHAAALRFMVSVPQTHGTAQDKPNVEIARQLPRFYSEMSNEVLLVYCAQNDPEAHQERLIREIMAVDNVEWDVAHKKVGEIAATNKMGMSLATVPYKIGLGMAVTAGLASIPLVFHLDTALWFNEHFVTAEVAEPEDLETWLEVGAWTWNWMEPPLGQISFFLLTLQFARNQMLNLGAKPYTHWLQQYRARRLEKVYPQYNAKILSDFAISDSWT